MGMSKIAESDQDIKAKKAGLIIGIPETIYMWTVSRFSNAYMEHYDGEWVVWRETYQLGKQESVSYKFIGRGNTFGYVLKEFEKYINFILRKRSQ